MRRIRRFAERWALGICAAGVALAVAAPPRAQGRENEDPSQREEHWEFRSYRDVATLFAGLSYTPQAWREGIREVPRMFLTNVPSDWRDFSSKEASVQNKQALFFRGLAPLALYANELVVGDRARIEYLLAQDTLDPDGYEWLLELAVRYGVLATKNDELGSGALAELLRRVDLVPVSLTLAQAAESAGWGTPRFGREGNALFGQWSWSGADAVLPVQRKAYMSNYGLRPFETPLMSVLAYIEDLNTNEAYAEFRSRREALRAAGERISGKALAETLTNYSARGAEYVGMLDSIIRINQLETMDDAALTAGPTVMMFPVGPR